MMKGSRIMVVGALLLLAFHSLPGHAAKLVQPPIKEFFKERNQVAVLELNAIDHQGGRGEFKRVKDLWGETPKHISIKVPDDLIADLDEDERYVVAYSRFRKHPMLRDVIEENPDGPSVLSAFVVRHALFNDSSELRYLVRELQQHDDDINQKKVLSRLLAMIDEEEGRTRTLAVFEFNMRSPFYAQGLRKKHIKTLQQIIESHRLTSEEEEFLLRSSRQFPAQYKADWIPPHCRQRIAEYGNQYDLGSFVPLLIKTCASLLATEQDANDIQRLASLLYSNSPGVGKSAFKALIAIDPQQTIAIARQTVNQDGEIKPHMETERVLRAYLNEFDRPE